MTNREHLMQAQMAMLVSWEAWANRVAELCDECDRQVQILDHLGGNEATARNLESMIANVRRLKP